MLSPKSYFLVLQAHGFCWTFSKYAVVACHDVSQQSIYISFDGYWITLTDYSLPESTRPLRRKFFRI